LEKIGKMMEKQGVPRRDLYDSPTSAKRFPDLFSIRNMLRRYEISPNKESGQHFLTNWNLLQREVEYANTNKKDVILEIGPGIGNLTELLAQKAKLVIAIEKDLQFKKCLSRLERRYDNIEVIFGDALEINFPSFNKVVSNLPFNIALPLIFKLLNYNFDVAVLLCQKRLAQRICASTSQKGYCRLSVSINRIADAEILKLVPKSAFLPPPEVDGAIVRIKKTAPKFSIPSEEFFVKVLKFMFFYRNRTVRTILAPKYMGVPKKLLLNVLSRTGAEINRKRIYEVTPRQFGSITWALWEELGAAHAREIIDKLSAVHKFEVRK